MDSSEKATHSYRLGMAITGLIYSRVLHVPRLLHLDRLLDAGVATLTGEGKERPDLVGLDQDGAWHVVEGKGRSSIRSDIVAKKAKENQAKRPLLIRGKQPVSTAASAVFTRESPIHAIVLDPTGPEMSPMPNFDCNPEQFAAVYYLPLLRSIEGACIERSYFEIPFVFVPTLRHSQYRIGLAKSIVEGYQRSIREGLEGADKFLESCVSLAGEQKGLAGQGYSISEDGMILVVESDSPG